jgi:transcriptional regulator NrdR family protein
MQCPKCKADTIVLDSRNGGVYRRRKCTHCDYRFTTTEVYGEVVDARKELEAIAKRAKVLANWIDKFLEGEK